MSRLTAFGRLLEVGLVAISFILSEPAFRQAAPAPNEPLAGRIVLVTDQDIVLAAASQEHKIGVTDKTEITLDGNASELMRLPLGSAAVVTTDGKRPPKAISIHATSLKWSRGG